VSFEGKFLDSSPQYPGSEVYSNCFVPLSDKEKAKALFLKSLAGEYIKLTKIAKEILMDANDIDFECEENSYWTAFYKEMEEDKGAVFDVWNLYRGDADGERHEP